MMFPLTYRTNRNAYTRSVLIGNILGFALECGEGECCTRLGLSVGLSRAWGKAARILSPQSLTDGIKTVRTCSFTASSEVHCQLNVVVISRKRRLVTAVSRRSRPSQSLLHQRRTVVTNLQVQQFGILYSITTLWKYNFKKHVALIGRLCTIGCTFVCRISYTIGCDTCYGTQEILLRQSYRRVIYVRKILLLARHTRDPRCRDINNILRHFPPNPFADA